MPFFLYLLLFTTTQAADNCNNNNALEATDSAQQAKAFPSLKQLTFNYIHKKSENPNTETSIIFNNELMNEGFKTLLLQSTFDDLDTAPVKIKSSKNVKQLLSLINPNKSAEENYDSGDDFTFSQSGQTIAFQTSRIRTLGSLQKKITTLSLKSENKKFSFFIHPKVFIHSKAWLYCCMLALNDDFLIYFEPRDKRNIMLNIYKLRDTSKSTMLIQNTGYNYLYIHPTKPLGIHSNGSVTLYNLENTQKLYHVDLSNLHLTYPVNMILNDNILVGSPSVFPEKVFLLNLNTFKEQITLFPEKKDNESYHLLGMNYQASHGFCWRLNGTTKELIVFDAVANKKINSIPIINFEHNNPFVKVLGHFFMLIFSPENIWCWDYKKNKVLPIAFKNQKIDAAALSLTKTYDDQGLLAIKERPQIATILKQLDAKNKK